MSKTFLSFAIVAAALLLVAGEAQAANNSFVGDSPYDYATAINWSTRSLPNSADAGLIGNGLYNTVQLSTYLDPANPAYTPSALMVGTFYSDPYGSFSGNGSLRLSGLATLKVVGALNVGYQNSTSFYGDTSGSLTIDGGTLTAASGNVGYALAPTATSTGTVNINGGLLAITGSVASMGNAAYTVAGGAFSVGSSLTIGNSGVGSLTLNGGNTTIGTLTAGQSGTAGPGSATVDVNTGATLTMTGTGTSMFGAGAAGNASATFTVNGGAVNVTGATAKLIFGQKTATNTAGLVVTSGNFTQSGTGSYLVLGGSNAGVGNFNQSGGVVSLNNFYVADYGYGNATISGTAALSVANTLNVADRGTATVTQTNGTVTAATLKFAPAHTGAGTYTISGGSLNVTTALTLAGGVGSGTFNVQGGHVDIAAGATVTTGALGNLNLSGGTINANGASIGTLSSFAFTGGALNNVAAVGANINVAGGTAKFNQDTGFNATVTGAITGAGAVTKTGAGALTLIGANDYTGKTTINGGSLTLGVNAYGNVLNAANGGADLQSGSLVFDYTGGSDPAASLRTTLASGKIYTSTGSTHGYGLGYVNDSVANTETVKIALYGDADLNGLVNLSDISAAAEAYHATDAVWAQGDFDYDGSVGLADMGVILNQVGMSYSGSTVVAGPGMDAAGVSLLLEHGISVVPEPSTLMLLGTAAVTCLMFGRRRRRAA